MRNTPPQSPTKLTSSKGDDDDDNNDAQRDVEGKEPIIGDVEIDMVSYCVVLCWVLGISLFVVNRSFVVLSRYERRSNDTLQTVCVCARSRLAVR